MKKWFTILFLMPFIAHAQHEFEANLMNSDHGILPYRILYPANITEGHKYPLFIFLHGAGERGNDNLLQLKHGSSLFTADVNREKYPAIVVFPQCPENDFWAKVSFSREGDKRKFDFDPDSGATSSMNMLLELVDSLSNLQMVDKQRIYVGGLSMGGMGTFELVYRRPDLFAAAVPICGGGNPIVAQSYNDTEFWIFHGVADEVVPVAYSKIMHEAIQEQGLKTALTIYPGVGHNSWDNAFEEPELLNWIFSKNLE